MSAVRFSDGATVEDLARTAYEFQQALELAAAEIERLRSALRAIRDCEPERHAWSIGVARAALGEDGRA